MDHKRYSNSWFYDYFIIEKWFKDRWVVCKNINWVTTSESIWAFSYFCKKTKKNCNDELLKSLKKIFDIYIAEKGLKYPANAHYRAIVHKNLSQIGFWIKLIKTISPSKKNREYYSDYDYYKYYVTTHYCSQFIN